MILVLNDNRPFNPVQTAKHYLIQWNSLRLCLHLDVFKYELDLYDFYRNATVQSRINNESIHCNVVG